MSFLCLMSLYVIPVYDFCLSRLGIGFGKYKVYIAVLEWWVVLHCMLTEFNCFMCLPVHRTGTFAIGIFQIALGCDLSGEVLKVGATENSGVSLEKTALNIDRGDKTSEKAPLLEMSNQNR